MLHTMIEQLGVEPAEAFKTTEEILGVHLVCALDGTYQLHDVEGREFWASTHWPNVRTDGATPAQFASPLLAWFRGMDAEVTLRPDRITGTATIDSASAAIGGVVQQTHGSVRAT